MGPGMSSKFGRMSLVSLVSGMKVVVSRAVWYVNHHGPACGAPCSSLNDTVIPGCFRPGNATRVARKPGYRASAN